MLHTLNVHLNKYEISFYFILWMSVCFYSVYEVFLARKDLLAIFGVIIESDGLAPGWGWIGGIRDVGDSQWIASTGFLKQLIPWLLIQLLISQTLKHMKIHATVIYSWYIIFTSIFLWNYCGFDGLRYLLFAPFMMCYFKFFPDKQLINIILLVIGFGSPYSPQIIDLIRPISGDRYKFFMLRLAFEWTILKSIDCRAGDEHKENNENFLEFIKTAIRSLAHCWYLPTLFLGPYITYDKFIKSVEKPVEQCTLRRVIVQLLNLIRFVFWMFFTEFIMHFVYVHAISIKPYSVMKLNTWAFYGLVYCLGHFFFLKYFVTYGITGEISKADNIDAPPPPKCISRIHLYSDMWRHFDRGLYEYFVRCIYAPILSWNIPQRKFVASLFVFISIYALIPHIHILSPIALILNFVGVTVESIFKYIGNSTTYTRLQRRYISSRNSRRFNCLLATPLLLFSITANVYNIHGTQFADYFVNKLIQESPIVILVLIFALYCCCQVSTEMRLNEKCRVNDNENHEFIESAPSD